MSKRMLLRRLTVNVHCDADLSDEDLERLCEVLDECLPSLAGVVQGCMDTREPCRLAACRAVQVED